MKGADEDLRVINQSVNHFFRLQSSVSLALKRRALITAQLYLSTTRRRRSAALAWLLLLRAPWKSNPEEGHHQSQLEDGTISAESFPRQMIDWNRSLAVNGN